ncbi:DUF2057 family protein [Photobacterium alginatilyticum]|uniref:YccT family protein n=1 Tax=Photobacterium alginatilyticum TaxID=1775171 RepID=UPI004067C833
MKFRTAILALAACGLSFSALANVTLELPYSAELVLVNGVETSGNDPLSLENGENQIAFRYQDSYRENGEHQMFKSDVVIMKFSGQDGTYQLKLPKLRTEQDAQRFNRSPAITLTDKQGKSVEIQQDKLIKHGLQFGRDFEKEIAQYNLTDKPAALKSAIATTTLPAILPASGSTQPTAEATQQGQNVAESMLNYWYSQADEATRERFKARINQS